MIRKRTIFILSALSTMPFSAPVNADEPTTVSNFKTHLIAPYFPPAELLLHRNGTADITCHLTNHGIAESCQIDQATSPEFGQAALYAALNSIMLPDFKDNQPVPTLHHQHYDFQRHWPSEASPILDTSHTRRPFYPPGALSANLGGSIKVTCTIDPIGIAHDCQATGSPEILRQTAIGYFTTARYIPAFEHGAAISHSYSSTLTWQANTDEDDPFKSH